jgi:hypothetical protein
MDERLMRIIFEEWESTGEMSRESAQTIDKYFDYLAEYTLESIDQDIQANRHDDALATLMRFSTITNAAAALIPAIIKKLGNWVNRLRSRVDALAKKMGADSFSISIDLSAPPTLSVELNFPVTSSTISGST